MATLPVSNHTLRLGECPDYSWGNMIMEALICSFMLVQRSHAFALGLSGWVCMAHSHSHPHGCDDITLSLSTAAIPGCIIYSTSVHSQVLLVPIHPSNPRCPNLLGRRLGLRASLPVSCVGAIPEPLSSPSLLPLHKESTALSIRNPPLSVSLSKTKMAGSCSLSCTGAHLSDNI